MEGPYRDLGEGFARLGGPEVLRRAGGGRLRYVEDALYELLRNSRDAGARNIYVASTLRARRYRRLVVIDDGRGIPETHKDLVFEPGVTTRHLDPRQEGRGQGSQGEPPHGAGLSLYHVKNRALSAKVLSAAPTAIEAVFDTRVFPEKSLQTRAGGAGPSRTNLPATLAEFARRTAHRAQKSPPPRLYHASPSGVLARLLENHIIQKRDAVGGAGSITGFIREEARSLGLEVSLKTVQRVMAGRIPAAPEVLPAPKEDSARGGSPRKGFAGGLSAPGGPILSVGGDDLARIEAVLRRAARSSYLDLAGIDVEARPGEVVLRASIFEPEDEYE